MKTQTPTAAALGTDFNTASTQLRDALVARGVLFTPRSSRQGLHIHRTGRIYQSFSLEGGPRDLHLAVFPRPRPGQADRPDHCWELMMSLDVVVRWEAERPNRAEHLHAAPAAQLRDLGFTLDEEDHDHIPGDPESYWTSEWSKFVFSVEEAANLVVALMEVDACQYPDGDEWMQTLVPLSTDQVEQLIARADPPDGRSRGRRDRRRRGAPVGPLGHACEASPGTIPSHHRRARGLAREHTGGT